jgi:hypothetical protein
MANEHVKDHLRHARGVRVSLARCDGQGQRVRRAFALRSLSPLLHVAHGYERACYK